MSRLKSRVYRDLNLTSKEAADGWYTAEIPLSDSEKSMSERKYRYFWLMYGNEQPIIEFAATLAQAKKIDAKKGWLRITFDMVKKADFFRF